MLDVHPPHESVHGWRDFLLHLLTITIGLLIALSLEGCVEFIHHRHLVHDADASLYGEIKSNSDGMADTIAEVKKEQANLQHDIAVLNGLKKTGKVPTGEHMEIGFNIRMFSNVSWKTAQSTGALSYMSYATAEEYSSIYNSQDELTLAERQAARDAILSLAPFVSSTDDSPDPTPAQATALIQQISILEGQLLLVDSYVNGLDRTYKKFLAAHAE